MLDVAVRIFLGSGGDRILRIPFRAGLVVSDSEWPGGDGVVGLPMAPLSTPHLSLGLHCRLEPQHPTRYDH